MITETITVQPVTVQNTTVRTTPLGATSLGTRPLGTWTAPGRTAPAQYAAARTRAHGPTAALWHAVQVRRSPAELAGACEITVCGSLARISGEQQWPTAARDVCPACVVLSR